MKNIKEQLAIYFQLGLLLVIWVLFLYFSGHNLTIDAEAIKKLPDVITIYIFLVWVFTKWLWKIPWFQGWLVPYPNLNGTWRGTLKSTWINPETNQELPPIPVVLVIKQTFSKISCVMFTPESESFSTTAQINEDDDSGVLRLTYNYTNRPEAHIRKRSEIHDGAAILKIVTEPKKNLEGEYWTGRKTTGQISLEFESRKFAQKYSEKIN